MNGTKNWIIHNAKVKSLRVRKERTYLGKLFSKIRKENFMGYTVKCYVQINERLVPPLLFSWFDRCRGPRPLRCRSFKISIKNTKLGRTPVGEWADSRRKLYLKTQNKHEKETSVTPGGFETATPASNMKYTQTQYLNIIRSFTIIFICCVPFVPFDHHQLKGACT